MEGIFHARTPWMAGLCFKALVRTGTSSSDPLCSLPKSYLSVVRRNSAQIVVTVAASNVKVCLLVKICPRELKGGGVDNDLQPRWKAESTSARTLEP